MLWLYRIGLWLYGCGIHLAAPFSKKAKLWLDGRGKVWLTLEKLPKDQKVHWFHAASLGEFEQGRPVIEELRKRLPTDFILLTFFSPSGYEQRKNYAGADLICYLPIDSKRNAQRFLELTRPKSVVFIKYEFWWFYFHEIANRKIPFALISAHFVANQPFFHPLWGKFWRKLLLLPNRLFVQDESSLALLSPYGIDCVVNGDTRADRVLQLRAEQFENSLLEKFSSKHKVIVAGSTWPADDRLLIEWLASDMGKDWKLILVPHDLKPAYLQSLQQSCGESLYRYTEQKQLRDSHRILLLDTIGMLSKVYRYGTIAYVGGGFGKGIHNLLEAVAYGIPVAFGPKYQRFAEAHKLLAMGAASVVSDASTFGAFVDSFEAEPIRYAAVTKQLNQWFAISGGSSQRIADWLEEKSA